MVPIDWKEYFSIKSTCYSIDNFWQSIEVWVLKPHVLNKKIGAAEVLNVGKIDDKILGELISYLKMCLPNSRNEGSKDSLLTLIDNFTKLREGTEYDCTKEVSLRVLYPKTGGFFLENIDVIIKDLRKLQITFIKPVEASSSVSPTTTPYKICLEDQTLKLLVPIDVSVDKSLDWLGNTLLPKLVGWMRPELAKMPTRSHKLIPPDKYISVYNEIKKKYFKSIQEIWTESTNPQKFIIEDIAIASYLLVLWAGKPQRFIDLGCGNGLLVHILNSESHLGVGLDVRARKIWNLYPKTTVLKESTVTPSLECCFSNVDWIIGNHSDELTPWIPVITAKSGLNTNFFLLPCCLYDFDGSKYARTCSKQTCYEEYMEYVNHICEVCGFIIDKDRLKIPSTKRNCFISRGRVYSKDQESFYTKEVDNFVNNKMNFSKLVKIREYEEKVKNCTQLDKNFLAKVVTKIAEFLINTSSDRNVWREGEFTDLKDVIELIAPEDRQKLKSECGGLQTLLKNHHNVFLVVGGKVKLRRPRKRNVPPHLVKKKECWFFRSHPDSCPLPSDQCSYIHLGNEAGSYPREP